MKTKIIPGAQYQHFKNNKFYRVIGVGKHTETEEDLVFYEPLYKSDFAQLVARPLENFQEEVLHEGVRQARFRLVDES